VRLLRALGMDGAVTYTFLARAANIAGSTGTVLLIVRFFTPAEQGYYYTLLSLASLQVVFEMGFSFVVQQLAAHECVHLTLGSDGEVSGDAEAHARLASALQLTLRWYTVAAVAMCLVLTPLGIAFFSRHQTAGAAPVAWLGPWLCVVLAVSVGLWCTPLYSFLEGCGHVRAVAAMRLRQAAATSACAWVPMLLGHGLYSPAAAGGGYIAAGLLFVFAHRRLLAGLLRYPAGANAVCWTREVWPFQWRIAVSWICSYFTVQILIPMIFVLRGPVEAGQIGMSLSITSYMTVLALAWTSTKATPFGVLIARRRFGELDQLFRRTLGQSLAAFAGIAVGVCAGAFLLPIVAPRLAARIVPPKFFAVLVLAAGANCIVQSLAVLLRSFKSEPFLAQSLVVAVLTLVLAALAMPRWGDPGAALSYLTATAVIGLPFALAVFVRARRGYLSARQVANLPQPCEGA
jgi:hypothetical protein